MAPINEIQAEALGLFHEEQGTRYAATQAEIDFHRAYKFSVPNPGPFLNISQATAALVQHNRRGRLVPLGEGAAIDRLLDLVQDATGGRRWGPDVAIKCFADLDLVFFNGTLRGKVIVKWASFNKYRRLQIVRAHKSFGITKFPHPGEKGQTRIVLNSDALLRDGRCLYSFQMMFSTLLHEMCHAYDQVRCPRPWLLMGWETSHGEQFCVRLTAVHRRAERMLGMQAIAEWESYGRNHYFEDENGGGYLTCGRGQARQGRHDTGVHRWSNAHVRSSRNGGRRSKGERTCVMM